jgi:hypothetical protein
MADQLKKPDKRDMSLTEFYLRFFGDNTHQIMDIIPVACDGDPSPKNHVETGDLVPLDESGSNVAEELRLYSHACWCFPELIYADDERGNEVWHHKRVQ